MNFLVQTDQRKLISLSQSNPRAQSRRRAETRPTDLKAGPRSRKKVDPESGSEKGPQAQCWTEGFLFKLFLGVLFCCFSGFQFSLLLDLLFGLPGFGWLLKVYNFSALLRRSIFIFGRKEREKTKNLSKCGPIYEPVFRAHLLLPSLIKVSFSSPLSGLIFQAPNL